LALAYGFRALTGWEAIDGILWLSLPLTFFFVLGVVNSLNLVDGHDGLAASIASVSSLGLTWLAWNHGDAAAAMLALVTLGAALGFLVYNFPPGKIFMGDTGSLMLGLMLALIGCRISQSAADPMVFLSVCLMLAVPMLDTWLAIVRRRVLRQPLFRADAYHMHHVLVSSGLSARATLGVLVGLQAFFTLCGVLGSRGGEAALVVGWVFAALVFVYFIRLMLSVRRTERLLASALIHPFPEMEGALEKSLHR
jgi:UDP-GlcNAc:undecaprenyl-phosphate GlcNAc-1-phosphate transferase